MIDSHPKFAVVGHPNKGKSSIVSALALDDSVHISNIPGTTYKKRSFPLKVDGKILYELIDTPGFQRARRVLSWLQKHDVRADKRHEVVTAFIHEYKDDERFNDEIELLEPIMNGAGIIYVVDASKPYGVEYEAEMEILRWTGAPSMSLINHIDDTDYTQEWKMALGQYFRIVRTFDPMDTSVGQHIGILESMAQLKEEWTNPVKASITLFEKYHLQKLKDSSRVITKLIYDSLSRVEKLSLDKEEATESEKISIEKKYKNRLREYEITEQNSIEKIWSHNNLQKEQDILIFKDLDLFSEEAASVFGLTKKELMVTGITSGAVTGAGIDLLFAGHTLLFGGAIGAIAGGIGAYFGFDELSEIKIMGQKLGRRYLQMGPMANRNFPYILLGRAVYHTVNVATLSHAKREEVALVIQTNFKEDWLDDKLRKSLEVYHKKFRGKNVGKEEDILGYEAIVLDVLKRLI